MIMIHPLFLFEINLLHAKKILVINAMAIFIAFDSLVLQQILIHEQAFFTLYGCSSDFCCRLPVQITTQYRCDR